MVFFAARKSNMLFTPLDSARFVNSRRLISAVSVNFNQIKVLIERESERERGFEGAATADICGNIYISWLLYARWKVIARLIPVISGGRDGVCLAIYSLRILNFHIFIPHC